MTEVDIEDMVLNHIGTPQLCDFIENVMAEHYVAHTGSRTGMMVHAECNICQWLDEHFHLTRIDFVNSPARRAWDRFVRNINNSTNDPISDTMVRDSWLVMYDFVQKIARQGVFDNLNMLSKNASSISLSVLRQIENDLQVEAVAVMLKAEGSEAKVENKGTGSFISQPLGAEFLREGEHID